MIKIVYFDENSAIDYLDIFNGGKSMQEKEEIKQHKRELAEKIGLNLFAKFNWFAIGGQAETGVNADFMQSNNSLLKTTVSNTILTDFIEKATDDERIEKFHGYKVTPPKNSIAYFKMFTPYLTMTNSVIPAGDGFDIDISKLDDALKSGKGYYEMLAIREDKKYVLRFNIAAFRNSYSIVDLSRMNLQYFAVKVGYTDENMLDINKEFSMEENVITSAFQLRGEEKQDDRLEVYDVMLAGVAV